MGSQSKKLHFIPRFILRKFKPDDQPPAGPKSDNNKNKRKKQKKKTPRPDFLVNKVDLENAVLTQRPISTEFALVDMYRDPGFQDNPYHLEDKLAGLECQASEILHRASEKISKGLTLTLVRADVDTLRKFLFLMKYRNTGMFDRYNHDDPDSYDADDRERTLLYMKAKGFSKPRDVWFDNLRHLLDLQMDAEKSWIGTLKTRIYPDDAMMFEAHLTHSFMTFCVPDSSGDEFLLTQNAFSIFEGPSTVTMDPFTQKTQAVLYNEYHNFAPVSPRLIIILRSHFLSPPQQDSRLQGVWDILNDIMRSPHLFPNKAGSILQDLPVKPCNILRKGAHPESSASLHKDDKFEFLSFRLSSAHVATINSLLLEEAHCTSSIVYHSPKSLKLSIEQYFSDESDGIKQVLDDPFDKRRLYLTTLEKILLDLGGTARCIMKKFGVPSFRIHMSMHVTAETAVQLLLKEQTRNSLPYVYHLLKPDASRETFWYDAHQAGLMMMLRTKMDGALRRSNLTNEEKHSVRLQRQDFFLTFPVERLWLYLKISRNMNKFDLDDFNVQTADLELEGKEDRYATFIGYFPEKRDFLAYMMYTRSMS